MNKTDQAPVLHEMDSSFYTVMNRNQIAGKMRAIELVIIVYAVDP